MPVAAAAAPWGPGDHIARQLENVNDMHLPESSQEV